MSNQILFIVGQQGRFSILFENLIGTDIDPTTVTFTLRPPTGDDVVYVYGTDDELVKSAVGSYYVDFTFAVPGIHHFRWESTDQDSASQGFVNVLASLP
jgi:hypothetical protein